jgi:myo-inositol-1(or 4)-monophosphatase
LFYASRGRGAFLNDKRLRVSKRTRLADALVGTGFPFRKGDNFARYLKMFETVMQACAGVRRPGAAALDLCYVAAGWYDGFFETGLLPWDMAAGTLIITEAGGLVGNFTGEADFLYQRELVAGNPKVYGQLVGLLAPYTRVIKGDEAGDGKPAAAPGADAPAAVLAASLAARPAGAAQDAAPEAAAAGSAGPPASADDAVAGEPERRPLRIRKADLPAPRAEERPRGPRHDGGDRARGTGKPAPGRPLPVKR